ncbi:hypothetical protein ACN9ML_11115 [Dyadobacter endophyticus]|uniref:hypothetical protein n=1 Tax=Dyadobacter endophyticus TaxID=1749036 RepID=UPI003CF60CF5
MKKTILVLAIILLPLLGFAQIWSLDKAHAKAGFTVTHNLISKKLILGIKATTKIDGQDFMVGTSLASKTVADEVELRATGEFKQN